LLLTVCYIGLIVLLALSGVAGGGIVEVKPLVTDAGLRSTGLLPAVAPQPPSVAAYKVGDASASQCRIVQLSNRYSRLRSWCC